MAISKAKRDKIADQAIQEIQFDRLYKQGKVRNWQKNEDLYYGKKIPTIESRANVDLNRMQEFVHTLLSKIDNALIFTFTKRKESQYKRVKRLNALRQVDQQRDNWDIKDIAGKKQAIIYGRAIYSYSADSYDGYCAHLDNVDVYDFLIDPSAGGLDLERARHLGRFGVVKDKEELRKGAKDGLYIKAEVERLIESGGNNTEMTKEELNKRNRIYDNNVWVQQREMQTPDKFKFWEWYTTYEGERYYLLITEDGCAIRVEKLVDIFESGLYPFWTWAAFVDLTEFWTPSYADYVREIFMAQAVSINQMLDNAEQINKPQRVVNVNAIENLAELKFRKEGVIKVKGDFDANKAYQVIQTPSINTPIEVFNILEAIQEKSSGVTAGAKGVSGDDKVGIYEGNQANAADRFGLLNKSYSFGYQRFAKLYECGVREHLTKKVAIDMIGPDGIETEEITRKDIFYKNDVFGVMVEASDAENAASEVDKRNKLMFLSNNAQNMVQNPKKAYELSAQIAGFTDEQIKQLLDNEAFGNAEILSEADRDIEYILDNKKIKPNRNANIAYKQRFVSYMKDHTEDMSEEQFQRMMNYIIDLEQVIIENSVREQANKIAQMGAVQEKGLMPTPTGELGAETAALGETPTGGAAPINNNPLYK